MEIRINTPKGSGWPLIALHKNVCDSPADVFCRPSSEKPCNFPQLRRYTLSSLTAARPCQRVLMRTAPLSKRFNFESILPRKGEVVNGFWEKNVFLYTLQRRWIEMGSKLVKLLKFYTPEGSGRRQNGSSHFRRTDAFAGWECGWRGQPGGSQWPGRRRRPLPVR